MSLLKEPPKPMLSDETRREIQARESYHVLKTTPELVGVDEELRTIQPAISIYNNARTPENYPDYESTLRLACRLSDVGFSAISDGGPGIMEAVDKGAFAGANPVVGLNIVLPHERKTNPYQDLSTRLQHFSPCKVTLVRYTVAYVVMPGDFGTLDELSESLILVQTSKTPNRSTILVGRDFWSGLLDQIHKELLERGSIAAVDADLIRLIDDGDEIIEETFAHYESRLETLNELGADTWLLGLQMMYCRCRFISEGVDHLKRVSGGLWFRCVQNTGETAVKR